MSGALTLLVTRRAERQIEAIDAWWLANRTAAPLLFKRELTRTLEMIIVTPVIGTEAKSARLAGVRRVLMRRTQYHVYSRAADDRLVVIAVWHAKRLPPQL